jgi:37-kD nucleoid-associated bacterial protein
MSVKVRFTSAAATQLMLARVGNPLREEPLQVSKEVFTIATEDQELLTGLFLKPFRNLVAHRFTHHSGLDKHEMHQAARGVFRAPGTLLERGAEISKRLYSKSHHPNIKSGDLCIAHVGGIEIDGETATGLCILKSESVTPFLSISAEDGDLRLRTEHGINPERIDKGCLIINHWPDHGYYVLTFDRTGADARFWVREFLGLQAVPDEAFLTNTFAELAVSAVKNTLQPGTPPEAAGRAAREVLSYFDDRENFDLQEFEDIVLKTPEAAKKFKEECTKLEEEQGLPLQATFGIAPKAVKKAAKQTGAVIKLDTGYEIHVKPVYTTSEESLLERGFDEEKGMKFIRVWFNEDISG